MMKDRASRMSAQSQAIQSHRALPHWLTGRLTSYTAAAGLGAIGLCDGAEGAIVYTDVPDTTITQGGGPIYINLDGVGQNEFAIAAFNNSVRVNPYNVGAQASKVLADGTYYVHSFEPLESINSTSAEAGGARFAGRVVGPYFYNFVETDKFVGLKWDVGGGNFHYGWARIDVSSANNGTATLFSFAYEDVANAAIAAGTVPEPTSLALLAAGGGAVALERRRRNRS
jgi:hypothetical protein